MNLTDRAKKILLTPKTEWEVINAETATPWALYTGYVLPLSLVAAAGQFALNVVFSRGWGLGFLLSMALTSVLTTTIGYFVAIHVFDLLAPHFASEKNLAKSAQLVAYALTPGFIATFLGFFPSMGGLIGAAAWVYSIYLMYLGVGLLKKTPEDKKALYLVVAWVVMIVVSLVVSALLGRVGYSRVVLVR
jgi:hypothetical protein